MPTISANIPPTTSALKYGARLSRPLAHKAFAPVFSGAVDQVVLSTAAQAARQSALLPNLVKFLTSKETFYRFWTEIAGAVVTGTFLLVANRRKNAAAGVTPVYRPPSRLSRRA